MDILMWLWYGWWLLAMASVAFAPDRFYLAAKVAALGTGSVIAYLLFAERYGLILPKALAPVILILLMSVGMRHYRAYLLRRRVDHQRLG
jgi:hypothetical protein